MTYQEKLKDPRWQKKRLEILKRDDFCCQRCSDPENTLHIHHRYYEKCDPWEYPDKALITMCEECHEAEKEARPAAEKLLLKIMKEKFFASDLEDLAMGFRDMPILHLSEVYTSALRWILSEKSFQRYLLDSYFKHLKSNKEKLNG